MWGVCVCGVCVCRCRRVSECGPGQPANSSQLLLTVQQRHRVDGVSDPLGSDRFLAGPQELPLPTPQPEVAVQVLIVQPNDLASVAPQSLVAVELLLLLLKLLLRWLPFFSNLTEVLELISIRLCSTSRIS